MFLDPDNNWTAEDWQRAVEFDDMLEYGDSSRPDWVRKRTPDEIEARILRMAILQVQQVEIRPSQNGTDKWVEV